MDMVKARRSSGIRWDSRWWWWGGGDALEERGKDLSYGIIVVG